MKHQNAPSPTAAARMLGTIAGLALCSVLAACGGGEQPEPPKPVLDEAAMRLRVMSASPAASAADDATGARSAAGSTYTLMPTAAWATADGRVLVCSGTEAEGPDAASGCEMWSPADGLHTAISDAGAQALRSDATALAAASLASARCTFAATGSVAAAALPSARFMTLAMSTAGGTPAALWPAEAATGVWLLFGTDAAGRPTAASRVQVQAAMPGAGA